MTESHNLTSTQTLTPPSPSLSSSSSYLHTLTHLHIYTYSQSLSILLSSTEHILYAKEHGVDTMTFDNHAELAKIHSLFPAAKLVLRILPPDDSHATSPLGTKFGANYEECLDLLASCHKLGANFIGVRWDNNPPHHTHMLTYTPHIIASMLVVAVM